LARPEGPQPEAEWVKAGGRVLGHQLEGLGSTVSFPSGSGADPRLPNSFDVF